MLQAGDSCSTFELYPYELKFSREETTMSELHRKLVHRVESSTQYATVEHKGGDYYQHIQQMQANLYQLEQRVKRLEQQSSHHWRQVVEPVQPRSKAIDHGSGIRPSTAPWKPAFLTIPAIASVVVVGLFAFQALVNVNVTNQPVAGQSSPSPATPPAPPSDPGSPPNAANMLVFNPPTPESAPVRYQRPSEVVSDQLLRLGVRSIVFDQIFQTVHGSNWHDLSIDQQQQFSKELLSQLDVALSETSLANLGSYHAQGLTHATGWAEKIRQHYPAMQHERPVQQEQRVSYIQEDLFTATNERFYQFFPARRVKNLRGTGLDEVWAGICQDILNECTQIAHR